MDLKEQIIQEFNSSIDKLAESFLQKIQKLIHESSRKKSESSSEKDSESEKEYVPSKRTPPSPPSKPKKLKKLNESLPKNSESLPETKKISSDKIKSKEEEKIRDNHSKQTSSNENPKQKVQIEEKKSEPELIPLKTFQEIEKNPKSVKEAFLELNTCSKEKALLISANLISILKSEPNNKYISVLAQIEAGKIIKKLIKTEENTELKSNYSKILNIIKEFAESVPQSSNHTNWNILKSQFSESFKKKNDSEMLALFKKISEGLAEKIENSDRESIDSIINLLSTVSKEWKNQDIKNKASVILTKCKEKFHKNKAEGSAHINDRLGRLIPELNSSKNR